MKRITLVLGLIAVMAAMMAALAAPAMAKDNEGHFDLDNGVLVDDVGLSPVYVTNEGQADELCSPLSSDAINNAMPGCIFGDESLYLGYPYLSYYPYLGYEVDFDGIDFDDNDFDRFDDGDVTFVAVDDFDRNDRQDNNRQDRRNDRNSNNNNGGNGNHNGGNGNHDKARR